jgi:cell division protein FtsI (penicillin-binding protein 3)
MSNALRILNVAPDKQRVAYLTGNDNDA